MNDRCEVPHCREESAMTYLGLRVCDRHWEQACGDRSKLDLRALAARKSKRKPTD